LLGCVGEENEAYSDGGFAAAESTLPSNASLSVESSRIESNTALYDNGGGDSFVYVFSVPVSFDFMHA